MARLMLLNECYPDDLTSGRDLRVTQMCAELAARHECFFVSFPQVHQSDSVAIRPIDFSDFAVLDDFRGERKSLWRHLRTSNAGFLRKAWPRQFRAAVRKLASLQNQWKIDVAINFTVSLSPLVLPLSVPKILDRTDCDTLMLERRLANRKAQMTLRERFELKAELIRERRREHALLNSYDLVVTISEPDRQKFLEVGRCSPDRVTVVQNGVAELALQLGESRKETDRSVVFWGNLDFPPNWTAVNHFYRSIFKPFLAGRGVHFYIVGRGGEGKLVDMSRDSSVTQVGFVPNLFEFVADKGVMINPMVEGSGLKNKVLEAFAMRLPVVSTSLGVDAIPVQNGLHLAIADDDRSFAELTLNLLDNPQHADTIAERARQYVEQNYAWPRVRNQFVTLVTDFIASRVAQPDQPPTPALVDR